MRSYLGITTHIPVPESDGTTKNVQLQSSLLCCKQFSRRHTGQQIAVAFEDELTAMNVKDSIDFIITDNAANMSAAFSTAFAVGVSSPPSLDDAECYLGFENDDVFQDLICEETEIEESISQCARQRLSCFAHTLQLVVREGLRETILSSPAIAKASRLVSLLYQSTIFKERFESKFGENRSIPTACATRWKSTLRQLSSIIQLNLSALTEVCGNDFSEVVFTARE